jgi:hypothetical protein
MRRIFEASVGATLTALAVASCGTVATSKSTDPTVVSAAARSYVETTYTRYADYLERLGKIATSTHLVILSGGESFTCQASPEEPASTITSWSNSEYCASSTAVVITGGTINAAIYDGQKKAQIPFIVGHELGHGRQGRDGKLKSNLTTVQHVQIEEQATCFSGEEVRLFDPQQATSIENILSTTPMDQAHGSSAAQDDAFIQGIHGGLCGLRNY